jgi:hypothetical protein
LIWFCDPDTEPGWVNFGSHCFVKLKRRPAFLTNQYFQPFLSPYNPSRRLSLLSGANCHQVRLIDFQDMSISRVQLLPNYLKTPPNCLPRIEITQILRVKKSAG